ncbi:MAG: diguanylate cyclase [Microthrixaceae bacterium]|nr:diguanylate cyclase [Microthrixaceae bacterium]MCO5311744.1 diguanylate cyclase [Microthrixaceae bacterium]HPB44937.1 diguanylate cyclase [Microthrixaceae bacterium]
MRRLTAIILGGLGLITGATAMLADASWLGIVAGLAALAAGVVGFSETANNEALQAKAITASDETNRLRAEVERLQVELADERTKRVDAQPPLAEFSTDSAGSFNRKFDDTATPLVNDPRDLSDTKLLADPETNLFSEAYFRVALDARIASARRHLRPVAVAIVEVLEGDDPQFGEEADPQKVTGAIRQTLRDADTACRMTDGRYAIILEDTPENGAVWTVERIRRNLTTRYGHHTMWAGVACYPAHAFSSEELLEQSTAALGAAREWKQDRIEVATSE